MACEKDTDRAKGPRNSFQRLRLAWMSQKTFVQRDKEFWRATVATNGIVWRPKKAKSVVQYVLSVSFTGNCGTPKKAKSV